MIRVLIVDDHQLVRLGLRTFLETEEDIEVVGEAKDGAEAVHLASELAPDVILMDLLMPGLSGVEAIAELEKRNASSRVIVLTSSLEDERMVNALRAGALSYLLKTSPAALVLSAVRSAYEGVPLLDPLVQRRMVEGLKHGDEEVAGDALTDRERDVLRAIAQGKSNQEIADALYIGVKTVKTHVSNILAKLDVLDRTQAAIYAIRNKLDE